MSHAPAFGQYAYQGHTTLHPIGLALLLAMSIVLLLARRRDCVLPIFLIACFIAPAQRVVFLTLDFTLLRILVVVGMTRVLIHREFRSRSWMPMDWAVLGYVVAMTTAYVIRVATFKGLVYQLGVDFDILGMYVLARSLIRERADLLGMVRWLAVLSIPVAVAFLFEASTSRNVFAVFGGVPELTVVRDGRLRCQGAFAHPILAGVFWASLLPLFVSRMWMREASRVLTTLACASAVVIIVACASSTPVMAVVFGAAAYFMFPARSYMRSVRWGSVVALSVLHVAMQAPVWNLIARVDVVSGSTGFHRFLLIDGAVNHFQEWWFVGTEQTSHWGEGLWDITNQYVFEAVRGGVLTLVMFVVILSLAFRSVGRAWRRDTSTRSGEIFAWAVGVTLFVHAASFISVAYFGQIDALWSFTLALATALEEVSGVPPPRAGVRREPHGGRGRLSPRPHGPMRSTRASDTGGLTGARMGTAAPGVVRRPTIWTSLSSSRGRVRLEGQMARRIDRCGGPWRTL